jgi:N utilization substance protein B
MSPGWQINKTDALVAEEVPPVEQQVEQPAAEANVAAAPPREIASHVIGETAAPLITQKRLAKVKAAPAKKRSASMVKEIAAVVPVEIPAAAKKKTGTRRKGREMAMQMLFQADIGKQTPEEVRNSFWNAAEKVDPDTRGFAEDLFRIATARQGEIDALIESHSANWRLPRMAAVDRNLLRAATAELLGFPGTPVPIVINESLEIARRYSGPESINFLNGVLDAISRSRK